MNINYDKDIDYMEIFFSREENYGDEVNDTTTVFKSEKNDKVVGYSFENASLSVFDTDLLHLTAKLAAMLKMARSADGITQSEAANRVGITLRQFQRLEAGEDTTLETLEKITHAFPNHDFSKMFKRTA